VFARQTTDVYSSLWTVHADGSELRRVNVEPSTACRGAFADPAAQGCFGPSWSPDGQKIVFTRGTNGDVDTNIYSVDADGTDLTQVTHTGGSESPNWGVHPLAH
jgi:Tol biopolymer transport system component